ncbi:MAG: hypothetical protein ACREMP_10190 [Candidatus Tyrphobacter sp.]
MRNVLFASLVLVLAIGLDACQSGGRAFNPPGGGSTQTHLVIGDPGSGALVTFPIAANGSVSPTYDIVGVSTGLSAPYDIFVDKAHGAIWAANYVGTITKYAIDATGDTSPALTIGPGGSTTLKGPTGIYLDSAATRCRASPSRRRSPSSQGPTAART